MMDYLKNSFIRKYPLLRFFTYALECKMSLSALTCLSLRLVPLALTFIKVSTAYPSNFDIGWLFGKGLIKNGIKIDGNRGLPWRSSG